mgnify:CR=1 FL=1
MKYKIKFPSRSIAKKFMDVLEKIPDVHIQEKIMKEVEKLADNPRPYGKKPFKKLKPPVSLYQFVAQYRLRIGNYRVLYDVDDKRKTVWILALRKRSERTYK